MRSLRTLPTIFNCFKYSTYVVVKPDGVSWSAYAVYDQGILTEWYGNLFFHEKPIQICCFDEGENFHFDHNVFCIPQETDWQKARYEENIVNDSQWLELIQYETQNPNWRDHVTEKLCKFVGVTR